MSVSQLPREERLKLLQQDLDDLSSPDAALCMPENERLAEIENTRRAIARLEEEHAE